MAERSADECVPLGPHLDHHTILRHGGAQIAVLQVAGLPWELEANATLTGAHDRLNGFHRTQADPRLTIGVHLCKLPEGGVPPGPEMRSHYGRILDREYRERVLGPGLSRNVLYVSIAFEPDYIAGKVIGRRTASRKRRPTRDERQDFRGVVQSVMESLAPYGVTPLGLRREEAPDGTSRWYSQVGEALYTILYGRWAKVPVVRSMGRAILRHRPIFGPRGTRSFEVRTPGATRRAKYYGAIFGLTDYPNPTIPGMLNPLLSAPWGFVLSQTYGYRTKAQAMGDMDLRGRQAKAHNDKGKSQAARLATAEDEAMDNEWVMGTHHLSLTVYADTLPQLDHACRQAESRMLDCGAPVAQEDWNLDQAFWGQLPGGWHKLYRKGKITSRNFSALAPLHNYPMGSGSPRWGDYVWDFRTTGATLYPHDLHYGEVGSVFVTGRTGRGKSFLLNAFMIGGVERLGARCIFFDKDNGSKPGVLAIGGSYLSIRHGTASGLAPHRVFEDEAEDAEAWYRLAKLCIVGEGGYELTEEEDNGLRRGVARQLSMPAHLRSWAGLRVPLGFSNPQGAGARLEKWCEGGPLGWVFANDRDEADFDAPAVGVDTTAVLDDPVVCGPVMAHLAYRTRRLAREGTRLVLIWDEVHKPLAVPAAAAIIDDELRTIRKKEGVVILATQGPGEVRNSVIGAVIREQTPTKIDLGNENAIWEDYEWLGYTAPEFRQVKHELPLKRRFLIKRPGASVVCEFDLSPIAHHLPVLSGRAATGKALDGIMARVGADPKAWLPVFMEEAPRVVAREATRKPVIPHKMETAA